MVAVPIKIWQGETYNPPPISFVDVNGNPINLTGYTATMSAKQTINSTNFAFQATTANYLTINGPLGTITINIPPTVTAPLAPFCGYWDIFIYSPMGYATRLVGGKIEIKESVTG